MTGAPMENLVTVFGGSGFVGTHVVRQLAKRGRRVRVAVRNPSLAHAMRLQGDVGQIDVVQANIRNEASVRRALKGADAAVNLVGVLYPTGRQGFQAVHAAGAQTVAKAAKAEGVRRLVHMSALGADAGSEADYARSKAEGEALVLEAFPGAAIVRPSIVFGPGDGFFDRFARMAQVSPVLPLIGGGTTRFQPVYVGDVARAIAQLTGEGPCGVFELGGPAAYTFRELMERLLAETGQSRILAPIPFAAAAILGALGDMASVLMAPPITSDQVRLLRHDNVVCGDYPGLAELGVAPTSLEAVLPGYLYVYRKGGQYADQEDRELAAERPAI
jgi:uncharacterized protein YbjT (DUF2867 family)